MTKQSLAMISSVVESIKCSKSIAIIGNGGNLAIAHHVSSDMNRYLGKFCFTPDAVHLSALSKDQPWHKPWVEYASNHADLILGITGSFSTSSFSTEKPNPVPHIKI